MATPAATNSAPAQATHKPSSARPDEKTLAKAGSLPVVDEHGAEHSFKTLYTNKPDSPANQRHLVVFIRHFYCGFCEQYVQALSSAFTPAVLAAHNTTLSIVGCGDHSCIPSYRARTQTSLPIYADQSLQLYHVLQMESSLSTGSDPAPKYMTQSLWTSTWRGVGNALRDGLKARKGGKISQNGGEWLFQGVGEEGVPELVWWNRMRHTRDHAEVETLLEVLGEKQS